jgi:hypothetical protein
VRVLDDALANQAERAGFEPAVQFDPYAALAKRCFRPLSHLSDLTKPALPRVFSSHP